MNTTNKHLPSSALNVRATTWIAVIAVCAGSWMLISLLLLTM